MSFTDKDKMYAGYEKGLFGNKLKTWNSYESFMNATHPQGATFSVRYTDPAKKTFKAYGLTVPQVELHVKNCQLEFADINKFRFNESAPDDRQIWQGELNCSDPQLGYPVLRYVRGTEKMSVAFDPDNFRNQHHAFGHEVHWMLKRDLSPAAYDDMMDLMELYPTSIIEFTVFSTMCGAAKQRNVIVWEIRVGY